MGCCVSTTGPKNPNVRPSPPVSGKIAAAGDRDPPQPEEETLKEVLSAETPIPKPLPVTPTVAVLERRKPEAAQPRDEQRIEEAKIEARTEATGTRSSPAIATRSEEVSEISQLSDLNSVSESVETASAARDEEVESSNSRDCSAAAVAVHRRSVGGPAPKLVGRERQRRPRSPDPAKKTAPSPDKRNRGAEKQSGGTATVASRRRSPSPGGYRCDPSSGAVRRSRSPATRTEGGAARVAKNMSPRKKIDGESAAASAATASEVSEEKSEAGQKPGDSEQRDFSLTNESLENPSVSLECFIFL